MDVRIDYCAVWNYEPQAVGLAEKILAALKLQVTKLELRPGEGGRFEVFLGKDQVFSKLKEKRFPEWTEIKKAIDARIKK